MTKKVVASKKISLAPLTVDEALEALLKTPPPADEKPPKQASAKKVGTKKR